MLREIAVPTLCEVAPGRWVKSGQCSAVEASVGLPKSTCATEPRIELDLYREA
jgi:hypothetical protein